MKISLNVIVCAVISLLVDTACVAIQFTTPFVTWEPSATQRLTVNRGDRVYMGFTVTNVNTDPAVSIRLAGCGVEYSGGQPQPYSDITPSGLLNFGEVRTYPGYYVDIPLNATANKTYWYATSGHALISNTDGHWWVNGSWTTYVGLATYIGRTQWYLTVVPEPSTVAILACGLCCAGGLLQKRRR